MQSASSQELLAMDSGWEKKFSLRVLPLMDGKKKRKKKRGHSWVGKKVGCDSGRSRGSRCIWSKFIVHNSQRTSKNETTHLLKKIHLLYLIYLQIKSFFLVDIFYP